MTITDIYGLGFKSWLNYTMDASDKDGGRSRVIFSVNSYGKFGRAP